MDLDGAGTAESATAQYYVYDAGQIVLSLDEDAAPTHRYLWGPAVDQTLADETVDDGTADDVLWTLVDHQNSVRDILTLDGTPAQWQVANHIAYDAFGKVTSQSNAAVDWLFGFTGRLFDEPTQLQNNTHRWYNAQTARWQSEDPIGFGGGDASLYRYVGNDAVNAVDPNGCYGDDVHFYVTYAIARYLGLTGDSGYTINGTPMSCALRSKD